MTNRLGYWVSTVGRFLRKPRPNPAPKEGSPMKIVRNMGTMNPETTDTPRTVVRLAKPQRSFGAAYFMARLANKHYDWSLRAKPQPTLKQSTVLMRWTAYSPGTKENPSKLVSANFTVADVAAEEEGRLIRLGRYAFFSDTRARNAAATAGAHNRFVAMHRTFKRKIGMYLHTSDQAIKRANKAKSSWDSALNQVALLEKFLKQKYKGKRKITKAQKAEAAELLKQQQAKAKRAGKRYAKWQKAAKF
jgi:hypothetical protein